MVFDSVYAILFYVFDIIFRRIFAYINIEESKTVNFCYHVTDPQGGLPLTEDRERFKLYVGDTGLMVTLAFWDKRFIR